MANSVGKADRSGFPVAIASAESTGSGGCLRIQRHRIGQAELHEVHEDCLWIDLIESDPAVDHLGHPQRRQPRWQ